MKIFSFLFTALLLINPAEAKQKVAHVDIMDHAIYSNGIDHIKDLPTHSVLRAFGYSPDLFFSPAVDGKIDPNAWSGVTMQRIRLKKREGRSASIETVDIGPTGSAGTNSQGKKVFKIKNSRKSMRSNTVFNVEIETIDQNDDGTMTVGLLMFIHDETYLGHYFRRMNVIFDGSQKPTADNNYYNPERVRPGRLIEDIPLKDLSFKVSADILGRKIIVTSDQKNILKVYPMAVGGFDMRTLPGMSGEVKSMTHEFGEGSYLTRDSKNIHPEFWMQNQLQRTYPSYYNGRPFIGIASPNPNTKTGYEYKLIAFHYQIDHDVKPKEGRLIHGNALKRGFVSHGCMRVRDKDLYELEAIVYHGSQDKVPVVVQNHLPEYADIDHPFPKIENKYKQVVFTKDKYISQANQLKETRGAELVANRSLVSSSDYITVMAWCKQRGKGVKIRSEAGYRSVWDTSCLTAVEMVSAPVSEVIDYLLNGGQAPQPRVVSAFANHQLGASQQQRTAEQQRNTNDPWNILNGNKRKQQQPRQVQPQRLSCDQAARGYHSNNREYERRKCKLFQLIPRCRRLKKDRDHFARQWHGMGCK